MKKIKVILLYLLILTLVLFSTGCSDGELAEKEEHIKELESEISELSSIVKTYEDVYGKLDMDDSKIEDKDSDENTDNTDNSKVEEIELGEKITIDDYCEFTISDTEFKQRIEPNNPSSVYSYYEVKDPKDIYLDTKIKFKNISTINMDVNDIINVKVIYDEKYNYTSFTVGEEQDGQNLDSFMRIKPLAEAQIHNISEMPIEVSESDAPLHIIIGIYGNLYKLNIR